MPLLDQSCHLFSMTTLSVCLLCCSACSPPTPLLGFDVHALSYDDDEYEGYDYEQ